MDIHYLGGSSGDEAHPAVYTACNAGYDMNNWISAAAHEVTCQKCKKTGIFKHGLSKELGLPSPVQKFKISEYETRLTLSLADIHRLAHYSRWFSAKRLSMAKLRIDLNMYWVERDLKIWNDVAACLARLELEAASDLVRSHNRQHPVPPVDDGKQDSTTASQDVNTFRASGYRIPEYETNLLLPSNADWHDITSGRNRNLPVDNLAAPSSKTAKKSSKKPVVMDAGATGFILKSRLTQKSPSRSRPSWLSDC
jgi:hypothetical protein